MDKMIKWTDRKSQNWKEGGGCLSFDECWNKALLISVILLVSINKPREERLVCKIDSYMSSQSLPVGGSGSCCYWMEILKKRGNMEIKRG